MVMIRLNLVRGEVFQMQGRVSARMDMNVHE